MEGNASVEANFGDESAKPFKYDIENCPRMVFKWKWSTGYLAIYAKK
jgi:hypothetical protein